MIRRFFIPILFFVALFIVPITGFAQKSLAKANKLYDQNQFTEAIPYYEQALKEGDAKDKELAQLKLANCYRILGEFEKAEENYKKLYKKKKKDPETLLNYALSLKASAKYDEAAQIFKEYKKINPTDRMADNYIMSCDLAQQWIIENITNDIKNIEFINSEAADFSPSYNGNTLVFSSSRAGTTRKMVSFNGGEGESKLDLFSVDLNKPLDATNKPIGLTDINSASHDATAVFTPDGKKIYFTRTVSGKRDKKANTVVKTLQVFVSEKDSTGKWAEPKSAFSFNSDQYSVGQPSLSTDSKRIYFMSDMPGGYGATDIWYSEKQSNGDWGAPINCGAKVNTWGYELFPFIRSNNVLYFSSNTHPGLGKLDIFSSTWNNQTKTWDKVENMKPPMNSIGDDFGVVFDPTYARGFLSSDRFNGKGLDDIYSFVILEPLQLTFNGSQVEFPDQSLFDGITYRLINNATGEELALEPTNGKYTITLNEAQAYTLSARREGFSYNKIQLDLKRMSNGRYIEIDVKPSLKAIRANGFLLRKDSTAGKPTPVLGAEVMLKDSVSQIEKSISEESGDFAFTHQLEAATKYKIIAFMGAEPQNKNGVTCTGQILNNGKPLKNAVVKVLNDLLLEDEVRTDDEGRYTFTLQMNMDEYMIVASKEGYRDNLFETVTYGKKPGDVINKNINLDNLEPVEVLGTVKDYQGTVANAQITLYQNKQVVERAKSDDNGKFAFSVMPDKSYSVMASKQGYFQKEVEVSTYGKGGNDIMNVVVKLDTLQQDKVVEIKNIYYDYDKADLRDESIPELMKLVQFLNMNPSIKIEVRSHTDSRGNDDYNLKLSQSRAESVIKFLKFEKIDPLRIIAKGYGETVPIVVNASTEEQHQLNRRTEFKILKR